MLKQSNLYDHTHNTNKRCNISLLIVFLFLFPPLQLLIIPFYFSQKNLFSQFFKFELKKLNLIIILYFIIIILVVNLISGYFFSDYPLQKNVSQLSISGEITTIQLLSIVVLAPVAEEFYFRGILFNYFEKRNGKLFILTLTSLIFSIIHFNVPSTPTLFILGISLGLIKLTTGSILITIIMHTIFNCIMLSMIL
jgi:membrane protease YdiL (CAAX protease family)